MKRLPRGRYPWGSPLPLNLSSLVLIRLYEAIDDPLPYWLMDVYLDGAGKLAEVDCVAANGSHDQHLLPTRSANEDRSGFQRSDGMRHLPLKR